jgi:hypothetical protein
MVPELIMDGTKIHSICVDNRNFVDSLNFLPMSLKSLPNFFYLNVRKGITPIYLTHPRIWIMLSLIRTLDLWCRLYIWWFVFVPDQNVLFTGSYKNIIHLQQSVPNCVYEAGYFTYYPVWETARLLRLFNFWRTLIGRETVFLCW